ncbi:MAG TPA: ABC transporter transmembrane domain-containing protein [Bacteroidia bacterium]|nr:ABC transporter transmembrane domain-containing protein [Bacteroidia bacterium]
MKTYLRLISFARPLGKYLPEYLVYTVLGVIFGLLNFTLFIPLLNLLFTTYPIKEVVLMPEFSFTIEYFKDVFNFYFYTIIKDGGKVAALQYVCLVIFSSVLLSNLFKFLSQRVLTSVRTKVVKNIREAVFNKITDSDLRFFYNNRKGDLISTLSNDVHEVENSVVSSLQVLVREPFMLIGFFILLFTMSAKLTLFTLLLLPVSFLLIAQITKLLKRDALRSQDLLGYIMGTIDETISGIRIVKAFNGEEYIKKKFDGQNNTYRGLLKSVVNKRELASPMSEFLGVSVLTLVFYYGGKLVLDHAGDLSASEFITYIALYSQILIPAKNISTAVTNIQKGLVSGSRLLKLIDTKIEITEKENAISLQGFKNKIEFRQVHFSHENFKVLNGINLSLEKGKTIALVGPSGAGKSTLADMVPRFYDVSDGEILIDDVNIKEVKIKSLRQLMGTVTQESILFNDTVANNIAFGVENPDMNLIVEAAKIANAHDFILALADGYNTNIGDRGGKLSGGQRQRLSIARAVFKNPPILILDEATSALDTESEKMVQEALTNLMKNRTTLVIAHRLSTIQHADEIVVLDKGEIVERGTHANLMNANGLYQRLCEMQAFDKN